MRPVTKHAVPASGDICRLSAVDLADRIRQRQLSVREVVSAFLDRIGAVNPLVNAIVSLRERAYILAEADAADDYLSRGGETGSLFGQNRLAITQSCLATLQGHVEIACISGHPFLHDAGSHHDDA